MKNELIKTNRIDAMIADHVRALRIPRRRSRDLEHNEQVALFRWAGLKKIKYPELVLMFAVPNAAKRSVRLGARMKAEGLKAGVPDIVLPVPRGNHHGLFIELKAGKNTTSARQGEWLTNLEAQGYKAIVCRGWVEASKVIEGYLGHGY